MLFILIALVLAGCDEKVTEPVVTEQEQEEVEEVVEPPAEGDLVGLLKEDPLLAFVGKTKEDVLQHFGEEPEILEMGVDYQDIPYSALYYEGFGFSCLGGFITSVSRWEGDFLGITLGDDYDEDQIKTLGVPAEEGIWDEVNYLIFWVEDYQLIFYLEDTLSVQYGIGQF